MPRPRAGQPAGIDGLYADLHICSMVEVHAPAPNEQHAAALPGLAEPPPAPLPIQGDDALVEGLFDLSRQGRAAILLDGLEVGQAADLATCPDADADDLGRSRCAHPHHRPSLLPAGNWALEASAGPVTPRPERQAELAQRLIRRLLTKESAQAEAFVAALGASPRIAQPAAADAAGRCGIAPAAEATCPAAGSCIAGR